VMCVLYLSFLLSQNVHKILAYVLLPFLLHGMYSFQTKKMVSVVVARRRISVPNDLVHTSLYLKCFMRWWYSRRPPVLLLRTAYGRLHKNCSGYFFEAAYFVVNGALYPGISMHCSMKSYMRVLVCCCCHTFAIGGVSFSSCVI
jgi:hypothetical protein